MGKHVWTLERKLRPEHVEDHAGFVAAREEVLKELAEIGVGALLFSSGKRKRRRFLHNRLDLLDRQIKACLAHPGSDLKPPRIGMDDRATKWFKKRVAETPDAFPLPPEEMLEEMHGHPVWELTEHRLLHQLDTDWPSAPFPLPEGPGFSLELLRRLGSTVTPEDAVPLAEDVERAVGEHLKSAHPELADASWRKIVETVIKGSLPGHPPDGPADQDLAAAGRALSATSWLRFWGEHGYTLRHGEVGGG